MADSKPQKTIVIGAGPVGTLAAIYAAQRGHDVEIYELRSGTLGRFSLLFALASLFSAKRQVANHLYNSICYVVNVLRVT